METILSISLLIAICVLTGVFIYYRWAVDQLQTKLRLTENEQRAVLNLVEKLGENITNDLNLEEILNLLTDYIVEATGARAGAVFLMNGKKDMMETRVVTGAFPVLQTGAMQSSDAVQSVQRGLIRVDEGIVGLVAREGKPLLVTDANSDPRVPPPAREGEAARSIMLCPLRVRERVLGVFAVVNKMGDRIFDGRDMQLLQVLSAQAAITVRMAGLHESHVRHRELQRDLEVAREFQSMLLPSVFPEIAGFGVHGVNNPALVIGGDLFDVFQLDEDHWGIVVADVVGKGIPGALVMATTRAVLRSNALGCFSPREVLCRVNRQMLLDTKEHVFITATYGILNTRTAQLKFARAGHEPVLVAQAEGGALEQYSPDGIALGVVGDSIFGCLEEKTITLKTGEMMVLYTDGVVEAMDAEGEEFTRDRLEGLLKVGGYGSARKLVEGLLTGIVEFTKGHPSNDDITILVLHKTG